MKPDDKQQPGQTVAPTKAPATPGGSMTVPKVAESKPAETSVPPAPQPAAQTPETALSAVGAPAAASDDPQAITWTASEFIAHAKSSGWYAALVGVAVVFVAVIFLVTHDLISVSVVIVAAVLMGIYGARQPRQMEYRLDAAGLSIGPKRFSYEDFRSFSIVTEGAFSSIVFMPLKRFAVPTTIYYAPQDEDRIVSLLSDRLPMEKRGHDLVDQLMHRIRF